MGQDGISEHDYRIVDRDGTEVAARRFANLDQAVTWVREEAMDRDLAKWTLQVHEHGSWADRMSTKQ